MKVSSFSTPVPGICRYSCTPLQLGRSSHSYAPVTSSGGCGDGSCPMKYGVECANTNGTCGLLLVGSMRWPLFGIFLRVCVAISSATFAMNSFAKYIFTYSLYDMDVMNAKSTHCCSCNTASTLSTFCIQMNNYLITSWIKHRLCDSCAGATIWASGWSNPQHHMWTPQTETLHQEWDGVFSLHHPLIEMTGIRCFNLFELEFAYNLNT